MECISSRETRCWYLVGLLSLSPDLQCDAVAHRTPGSSHAATKVCSLTHHHQLAIPLVASISSPPTWNGRHGCLPSIHTTATSTVREDSLARQGPSSLPWLVGADFGARPVNTSSFFEPKDASKGLRRHSPVHDSLTVVLVQHQGGRTRTSSWPGKGLVHPLKVLSRRKYPRRPVGEAMDMQTF